MTISKYQVSPLELRRDLIVPIAHLFEKTWPEHYGPKGPGFAQQDLTARCRLQGLPIAFVAHQKDGEVLGCGSLAKESFGAAVDEGPWIVGLCVRKTMRNKGIASTLVSALEDYAKRQGFLRIFATTITAQGLLAKAGFQDIRTVEEDRGNWKVLKKDFSI